MIKALFKLSGFKVSLLTTLIVLGVFVYGTADPTGSFLNLLDKK